MELVWSHPDKAYNFEGLDYHCQRDYCQFGRVLLEPCDDLGDAPLERHE